jgi:glycosyltransferase involved in cell wall biosynthesis
VEALGDEFSFDIITADRDLGDTCSYPGITSSTWHTVGKARVLYLSPDQRRLVNWCHLLRTLSYDAIYLNSFFSTQTIRTLLLRRLHFLSNKPMLLAPRGEFCPGALSVKGSKKRVYIAFSKLMGLTKKSVWQASSEIEKQDIATNYLGIYNDELRFKVLVAEDIGSSRKKSLIANSCEPCSGNGDDTVFRTKKIGSIKAVFLSRIVRNKNVDKAIRILSQVKGQVEFDIYGPIEDESYWSECEALIATLPEDIRVIYRGAIHPDEVPEVLSRYHLFLFPTLTENFGHVILEALDAGCLALISDRTPWQDFQGKRIGWTLPLDKIESFGEAVGEVLAMDDVTFQQRSQLARLFAFEAMTNPAVLDANRQLFLSVLGK